MAAVPLGQREESQNSANRAPNRRPPSRTSSRSERPANSVTRYPTTRNSANLRPTNATGRTLRRGFGLVSIGGAKGTLSRRLSVFGQNGREEKRSRRSGRGLQASELSIRQATWPDSSPAAQDGGEPRCGVRHLGAEPSDSRRGGQLTPSGDWTCRKRGRAGRPADRTRHRYSLRVETPLLERPCFLTTPVD